MHEQQGADAAAVVSPFLTADVPLRRCVPTWQCLLACVLASVHACAGPALVLTSASGAVQERAQSGGAPFCTWQREHRVVGGGLECRGRRGLGGASCAWQRPSHAAPSRQQPARQGARRLIHSSSPCILFFFGRIVQVKTHIAGNILAKRCVVGTSLTHALRHCTALHIQASPAPAPAPAQGFWKPTITKRDGALRSKILWSCTPRIRWSSGQAQ